MSSTVFSAPHKLASLFKMEEELLDLLNNSSLSDRSESISKYLHSSESRFRQIAEGSSKNQVLRINPLKSKRHVINLS